MRVSVACKFTSHLKRLEVFAAMAPFSDQSIGKGEEVGEGGVMGGGLGLGEGGEGRRGEGEGGEGEGGEWVPVDVKVDVKVDVRVKVKVVKVKARKEVS